MNSNDHIAEIEIPAGPILSGAGMALPDLVLRRVRLLARRRVAWLRKIWAELTEERNGTFTVHTEVDGYLYDRDLPSLEAEWLAQEPSAKYIASDLEEIEYLMASDPASRLSRLTAIFALSRAEADILQACLAVAIDPNLGRVYAYLQDNANRPYVTEPLVARLFGHGVCLSLQTHSPLKVWQLVRETTAAPGEPARLECDPFIKNWLLGLDEIDSLLYPVAGIPSVYPPLTSWPLQKPVETITGLMHEGSNGNTRFFIGGPEGSGRRSYAALTCMHCGLSLLTLNADRIPENRWPQFYLHAQRQAFLSNQVPAWFGSTMPDRFWPEEIQSYPVQFVIGESDSYLLPSSRWMDRRIILPSLSPDQRRQLWQRFVPISAEWERTGSEDMILHYQTTIGQIVAIGQKQVTTLAEAYAELRMDSARRLGNLAQPMNSAFTWDDLIVPDHLKGNLGDFIFEAKERVLFWEGAAAKRLFPQGKSLIALFTGEPGTGKTMSAQVIAACLKLDLFRIDLSTVISKYIGESAKNIERILTRAKDMNVVLLFDEADSLFGKRTEIKDAHDRYANTDTNFLLQAIEQYPGVVILASNKKSNIDSGFMRRLRYVLEFPKPDANLRLRLWTNLLAELAGADTASLLEDGIGKLAQLVDITGAQIKLAILDALFMARRDKTRLCLPHLLKGIERELMKEGKGLGRQVQQLLK